MERDTKAGSSAGPSPWKAVQEFRALGTDRSFVEPQLYKRDELLQALFGGGGRSVRVQDRGLDRCGLMKGDGRTAMGQFLGGGCLPAVAARPSLGIAVSVRSSYEDLVIPSGLVPDRLSRVEHTGFAEHEYDAVHRFFEHFGIEPTVPLLVPEFSNPLFLKIVCTTIRNQGLTQIPVGLQGITALLHMFIESVHQKLCRRMNYDPKIQPRPRVREGVCRAGCQFEVQSSRA